MKDLVLPLCCLVDAFEHLISLGPQVRHFAAAEASTTPEVQICCMNEINHSCSVVQRTEETQHHALHFCSALAFHELISLDLQGGKGQVDQVVAATQGLCLWIGGLEEESIPEPEHCGSWHQSRIPPHESAVKDGRQLEPQSVHTKKQIALMVCHATFQQIHILHRATACYEALGVGVPFHGEPVVFAVHAIVTVANQRVQEPKHGLLRGLCQAVCGAHRGRLLVTLWQQQEEGQNQQTLTGRHSTILTGQQGCDHVFCLLDSFLVKFQRFRQGR
mmetsp:Transcript_81575/g.166182  ORF Transcript_81575/g.166182 Transcript_81575/m.166182 type:complete len:275 (+) Transcript_81575:2415-3239(+)